MQLLHSNGCCIFALKRSTSASPLMIRIHCATQDEADAAWRMLTHVPDPDFQPVALHLDGHGQLYVVTRDQEGSQTSAHLSAHVVRTDQA